MSARIPFLLSSLPFPLFSPTHFQVDDVARKRKEEKEGRALLGKVKRRRIEKGGKGGRRVAVGSTRSNLDVASSSSTGHYMNKTFRRGRCVAKHSTKERTRRGEFRSRFVFIKGGEKLRQRGMGGK